MPNSTASSADRAGSPSPSRPKRQALGLTKRRKLTWEELRDGERARASKFTAEEAKGGLTVRASCLPCLMLQKTPAGLHAQHVVSSSSPIIVPLHAAWAGAAAATHASDRRGPRHHRARRSLSLCSFAEMPDTSSRRYSEEKERARGPNNSRARIARPRAQLGRKRD